MKNQDSRNDRNNSSYPKKRGSPVYTDSCNCYVRKRSCYYRAGNSSVKSSGKKPSVRKWLGYQNTNIAIHQSFYYRNHRKNNGGCDDHYKRHFNPGVSFCLCNEDAIQSISDYRKKQHPITGSGKARRITCSEYSDQYTDKCNHNACQLPCSWLFLQYQCGGNNRRDRNTGQKSTALGGCGQLDAEGFSYVIKYRTACCNFKKWHYVFSTQSDLEDTGYRTQVQDDR